jgi:fused signal recognition particle receptor
MFSFLKKKPKPEQQPSIENEQHTEAVVESHEQSKPVEEPKKTSFFGRLKQGLSRTSSQLTEGFANLFLGKKEIDDDLLEELETQLLTADLGIDATQTIIQNLTDKVERKQLSDAEALFSAMRDDMVSILEGSAQPFIIPENHQGPFVILMVGINGVGKTTTIGKLAKQLQNQGKSVMLAAGDTFRAAAVEQLQVWGERNDISVVAQKTGADSASVIFDAIQSAKSRDIDVLIADTAGRLHTQSNLMEELKKVKRVMAKVEASAPHEVMLVLDAGTGQNALNQAQQFNDAVGVTGITLTKLDGTAKGGIIFAIAKKVGLPIRFIGVGEKIDDLRQFEAADFVDALLGREE